MEWFWLVLELLIQRLVTKENLWLGLGSLALAMFASRFLIQWLASERAGHSVMPVGFWILSLVGGALLFSYSVYRGDPIFIIGQSMGLFIYFRNLYMIARDRKREDRMVFRPADFFKP